MFIGSAAIAPLLPCSAEALREGEKERGWACPDRSIGGEVAPAVALSALRAGLPGSEHRG